MSLKSALESLDSNMAPFIQKYEKARDEYIKLLETYESKGKNIQMDDNIFDKITDAIEETVRTADEMQKEAKKYKDEDTRQQTAANTDYDDATTADPPSITDFNNFINKLSQLKYAIVFYTKRLERSSEIYNDASLCYTRALAEKDWWSASVQSLKDINKTRPIGYIMDRLIQNFKDSIKPMANGASYEAIKALHSARGRHKKSKKRQTKKAKKGKKRQTRQRKYK